MYLTFSVLILAPTRQHLRRQTQLMLNSFVPLRKSACASVRTVGSALPSPTRKYPFLTCSGLFSCTSSGAFRYVELSKFGLLSESDGVLILTQLNEPELDSATLKWTVPGPLYHVAFYPDLDSSPSFFAYGGEHVPLSLWSIKETLEHYKNPSAELGQAKAKAADNQSGEGGTGKRKSPTSRGSKALNLHPGEIWRARNVRFS